MEPNYKLYKSIVIEDADEAPTKAEIIAIEKALGAKLPDDFLDFLNFANGGSMPDYNISIPLSPNPEEMSFSFFTTKNGASNDTFLHMLDLQRSPKYIFNIPDKVLPIAISSNNYLYLDLREKGSCTVVAFVEGLPAWTGLHQHDTVIKVANSFSEYLDALEFDKPYNKAHLEKMIAEKNVSAVAAMIAYLDLALPNWREEFGMHDIN